MKWERLNGALCQLSKGLPLLSRLGREVDGREWVIWLSLNRISLAIVLNINYMGGGQVQRKEEGLCFALLKYDDSLDESGRGTDGMKEVDSWRIFFQNKGNFLALCPRALSLALSSLTFTYSSKPARHVSSQDLDGGNG